MTNQALQTLCQVLVVVGILLTAIGGFGAYIFGQRATRDREAVIEKKEANREAKEAYVGRLEHKSETILSAEGKIYPKFEFGDSGAIFVYAGPQGAPLFKIAEDNDIIVEVVYGELKVSTKIRDSQGHIIAEVVRNEWKVNPNKTWDRNYTKNALEVRDPSGEVILQLRLVEDRVQFQAKLYDASGRRTGFGKMLGPEGWGGAMEFTGPNNPELSLKITPLFKYPSASHLGELVEQKDRT